MESKRIIGFEEAVTMLKRTLVIMSLGLLVADAASAQTQNAIEQELIKLEQTLADAAVKKDRATFERLYADDYVYTHSNGSVLNKAQDVAESVASDTKWTSIKLDDVKVRIFGDVAIVTALETSLGAAKGYVPGPRRYTDIWVKRNSRWQMIGGQATLVPAKSGT